MYKGWDEEKDKAGKSALMGKIMLAGMDDSHDFNEKKEACIRKQQRCFRTSPVGGLGSRGRQHLAGLGRAQR